MEYELNFLDEKDYYWVLDKPAGLTVHPGAIKELTLTELLIKKFPQWSKLNWLDPTRPGIVHRLDKDTSGLILIAKNPESLIKLQDLFKQRTMSKTYRALAVGKSKEKNFEINASISRDSDNKTRQSGSNLELPWNSPARTAKTKFALINEYSVKKYILSEFKCFPQSGRMHQIRVHLKLQNLPIAGDSKYSNKISRYFNKEFNVTRQMLHAERLEFIDPWTKKIHIYTAKLPEDYINLIDKIS